MPDSVIGAGALIELAEIAARSPEGCFVEIGVYKGGSAAYLASIAEQQKRQLFLYDTFSGIPFKGCDDRHEVGDFADTSADAVREAIPTATVVKGVFPESLVSMPPVAFVHVDCDQYESVKAACKSMPPLMVNGGALLFDDYGCLPGATKAVDESFPEVSITRNGKAVVYVAR